MMLNSIKKYQKRNLTGGSEHIAPDFIGVIVDKLGRSRRAFVFSDGSGIVFEKFVNVIGVVPRTVNRRLNGSDYIVVAVFRTL